jgi:hypothetical protein
MKKISQSSLRYIGILLLSLGTTQCFERCKPGGYEDTTRVDLVWDSNPCSLNVPSELMKTKDGLVCHVASEKATYFLDVSENCWKFTQTEGAEGVGLTAEKVGDIEAISPFHSFCFSAGVKEKPSLFYGMISMRSDVIYVSQLEGGSWIEKKSVKFSHLFPSYKLKLSKMSTACTIESNGQYCGCILFFIKHSSLPKTELVGILYNPSNDSFEKITIDQTYAQHLQGLPRATLQTSIGVAPNKIILGKSEVGNAITYDLLSLNGIELVPIQMNIPGTLKLAGAKPSWQSFGLLVDNAAVPVNVPIFSSYDQQDRKYFRIDEKYSVRPLKEAPPSLQGKDTLVIPFANALYVLADGEKDNEGKSIPIGYKATLGLQPPNSEEKK